MAECKLGTGSSVQSFPHTFVLSTVAPLLLLNQPNMVFSQHDYSVALPFQCLPPDFPLPRSTPQAQRQLPLHCKQEFIVDNQCTCLQNSEQFHEMILKVLSSSNIDTECKYGRPLGHPASSCAKVRLVRPQEFCFDSRLSN